MHLLENQLLAAWPREVWSSTRILVAVSGGADSVALLHALQRLSSNQELLRVAHFNHQWRGNESDEDAAFVQSICQTMGVKLDLEVADTGLALQRSEESAREARYRFLVNAAYACGARYVVTAHTGSDRMETMLHNLCRGTGLAGVVAPGRVQSLDEDLVLVRPLIRCFRSDVLDYLRVIGANHREDSSNDNQAYRRNFLRHSIVARLREVYGDQLERHWLDFSEITEEARATLEHYADRWLERYLNGSSTGEVCVPQPAMETEPWPVLQLGLEKCWKRFGWSLQSMTRHHWQQIRQQSQQRESCNDWQPRLNLPGNLQLWCKSGWIKIAGNQSDRGVRN